MRSAARVVLMVAMFAPALACDPIMSLNGVVRTVPGDPASEGADRYAGGTAISGAQLLMICPNAEPVEIAVTDGDGRVEYGSAGRWRMECAVRVEAPEFHPQSFPIEELCVLRSGTSCHFLAIFAELLPSGPPGSPDDVES
jgi:hypothetical protein